MAGKFSWKAFFKSIAIMIIGVLVIIYVGKWVYHYFTKAPDTKLQKSSVSSAMREIKGLQKALAEEKMKSSHLYKEKENLKHALDSVEAVLSDLRTPPPTPVVTAKKPSVRRIPRKIATRQCSCPSPQWDEYWKRH